MNLGMDDAAAAADAILDGRTNFYSEERHPVGNRILRNTERLRRVAVSNSPFTAIMLTLVAGAASTLPPAHKAFLRQLSEL